MMDESGSDFLDMANKIIKFANVGNQVSLAKQLVSDEYIAVVIYKGTKEEIEAMR